MPARKRGRAEMEASETPAPLTPGLLTRLRNMWVFANVMQFIHLFGSAFKVDEDFDIEDLEDECLNPAPHYKLAEIGLCLLKAISSQRGLTLTEFDEYTHRQWAKRSPETDPFDDGEDNPPKHFLDFDIVTQLRVLHQLSLWIMAKPKELRERMKRTDEHQIEWRIDAVGWDKQDRTYYLLDDNRMYRRTDPPIPAAIAVNNTKKATAEKKAAKPKAKPKPKSKPAPKPARQGTRASRRLKTSETPEPGLEVKEEDAEEADEAGQDKQETVELEVNPVQDEDHDLGGGYRWECVAITLQDYQAFLESIKKSRDVNEKNLYKYITEEVLPIMEKQEDNRQKKIAKRQRELMSMEKMAHAKRSSRIAGKAERDREEAEHAAAEAKRQRDLVAARADEDRKAKMEAARESRMMTREQRLKEREYKRILHEEELANLSEDSKMLEAGERKISERRLKAEMEKKKKELEELQAAEEDWVFDCAGCGVYGENVDDGTPIIACEKCSVWQHLKCLGIEQAEADQDDFHFVCNTCVRQEQDRQQRAEDAKKPKIAPLKFKVAPTAPATADGEPPAKRKRGRPRKHPLPDEAVAPSGTKRKIEDGEQEGEPSPKKPKQRRTSLGPAPPMASAASMHQTIMNGPTLSPQGQMPPSGANGHPPPGLVSPPRNTFINYHPTPGGYGVSSGFKQPNGGGYGQSSSNGSGYGQLHVNPYSMSNGVGGMSRKEEPNFESYYQPSTTESPHMDPPPGVKGPNGYKPLFPPLPRPEPLNQGPTPSRVLESEHVGKPHTSTSTSTGKTHTSTSINTGGTYLSESTTNAGGTHPPTSPTKSGAAHPTSTTSPLPKPAHAYATPSTTVATSIEPYVPGTPASPMLLARLAAAASPNGRMPSISPGPALVPAVSPSPAALSPPDRQKLSPMALPAVAPGLSPTKPAPTSPQPPTLPAATAAPLLAAGGKSPVIRPPVEDEWAKGLSPRKQSPPPLPPQPPL